MRTWRTWTAAALAAGLVLTLTGCGDSDETDSVAAEPTAAPMREVRPLQHKLVRGTGPTPPMSDAELQDLTRFTEQRGEDVREVKARYRGSNAFTAVASSLGGHNQDIWVSSGISQEGQPGNAWMVFTEKPPQKVFNRLAMLGTDTDVRGGTSQVRVRGS